MIEALDVCKLFKSRTKKKEATDSREIGGKFHALSSITFDAEKGKILSILGPNGAGKTTLMRILSTALKPTTGRVLFDDVDTQEDPITVRKKIGFLSGNTGLYGRLSPTQMVNYYGKLHGMSQAELDQRRKTLFDQMDIDSYAHKRNDHLSAGMKQKVNIARTLIHNPDIIIFDEPTTGLDVKAAEQILQLVESLKEQGHTILFSTHHMHEVDRLADRVLLINMGKFCFEGDIKQMREQGQSEHLDIAFLNLIGEGSHAA